MNDCRYDLQAFIPDASFGSPDTVQAMTAKDTDGMPASSVACSQAELALVAQVRSIGKCVL